MSAPGFIQCDGCGLIRPLTPLLLCESCMGNPRVVQRICARRAGMRLIGALLLALILIALVACWHWWEGFPEQVRHCAQREVAKLKADGVLRDPLPEPSQWARENADSHVLAFAIVHADRYRTIAAAHDAREAGVRS
ncbi:MAG: hypothetical protein RQ833_07410 [Sphingomonadaceae bacterium]|nr:hypothetical protein [Sphingomonadaceae bacterium]